MDSLFVLRVRRRATTRSQHRLESDLLTFASYDTGVRESSIFSRCYFGAATRFFSVHVRAICPRGVLADCNDVTMSNDLYSDI